jgi:tRNA dimethylallyltransferase
MEEAGRDGAESLHRRLAAVDPALAGRLHPHDQVKIIRALEVHQLSGRPLSEAHREHGFAESTFVPLLIGLTRDRDALYRRIEERVESQLAKGLLEETRRLLARYGRHLGSMKGLGYRQMAGYLAEEYSYEEAVRRLKRDTRHFAKRQMTWFRKEPGIEWLSVGEQEPVEQVSLRTLELVGRFLTALATQTDRETASP